MKILLIRFSALGDVAMMAPVLRDYALKHPDYDLTVLSKPFHAPLFDDIAPNVHFLGRDPKRDYNGIRGLYRLYRELHQMHFDMVIDMHDVLRTKILRKFFRVHGYPVRHIDKHRSLRRKITAREGKKQLQRLPTSFENYLEALCNSSDEFRVMSERIKSPLVEGGNSKLITHNSKLSIGIAPFAAHQGKIYPVERMEKVIEMLIEKSPECRIILFGGGGKEREQMTTWAGKYSNVELASTLSEELRVKSEKSPADNIQSNGNLNWLSPSGRRAKPSSLFTLHSSLYYELQLMKDLDVMLSMDSANMHLASLVGTRVVSIWGATHPWAGFLGWGQSEDDCVQRHDLKCRPCSIYGNKPCLRGDMECMNIEPSKVVEQLLK